MKQIKIKGKNKLTGTIRISGAKNAAVALIPAAILSDEEVTICNVPEISDINSLEEILKYLGVKFSRATESIIINAKDMTNKEIPEDISRKLRASYYFMGALLAKFGKAEMSFPGGCNIGALDYKTGKQILQLLQDTAKKENMTVLIITHNGAIAPMADKVIHFKNGTAEKIEINKNPISVEQIEW